MQAAAAPKMSSPTTNRYLLCVLLTVISLCIVALAAPTLFEEAAVQELKRINTTLYADETLSNDDLAAAIAHYQTQRRDTLSPHHQAELALLYSTAAKTAGTQSLYGLDALFKAKELLENSLAAAPANSFAWARYAFVSQELHGDTERMRAAWLMSIFTAPFEPKLLLWRIEFTASWKNPLSLEENQLFEQQVAYALRVRNSLTLKLLAKMNRPDLVSRFIETLPPEEQRTNLNGYRYFREQLQNQPER